MYPPSPKPMGAATVGRRAGLLVQSRPRARTWAHGTGVGCATPSAARRRLLAVASLGVRESLPAQLLGEEPTAVEVDDDANNGPAKFLPSPYAPDDAKTVRVKFVLEKECAFGQQFLVVGDDPALGHWDPAKAVALDWSDGHVWTVKTDLPANKLIEFKFLLRDASGHVCWQHGANRALQTTETQNILVVHEDWDQDNNQRVSEEELTIASEDITLFSDDLAESMLANEPMTGEDLESNKSSVVETPTSLHGDGETANEENQPQFILGHDQKIVNELHGQADTRSQNGYPSDDDNATAMCQEDVQIANKSTSIFENDLAWARKAMRQLLRSLGFQIGTTRT